MTPKSVTLTFLGILEEWLWKYSVWRRKTFCENECNLSPAIWQSKKQRSQIAFSWNTPFLQKNVNSVTFHVKQPMLMVYFLTTLKQKYMSKELVPTKDVLCRKTTTPYLIQPCIWIPRKYVVYALVFDSCQTENLKFHFQVSILFVSLWESRCFCG